MFPGQYSASDEEDVLDRDLDADVPRSTEVTLTDGIAGDILDFKTGTFLDNTEIRVSECLVLPWHLLKLDIA